jgi:hypothetical protein
MAVTFLFSILLIGLDEPLLEQPRVFEQNGAKSERWGATYREETVRE